MCTGHSVLESSVNATLVASNASFLTFSILNWQLQNTICSATMTVSLLSRSFRTRTATRHSNFRTPIHTAPSVITPGPLCQHWNFRARNPRHHHPHRLRHCQLWTHRRLACQRSSLRRPPLRPQHRVQHQINDPSSRLLWTQVLGKEFC